MRVGISLAMRARTGHSRADHREVRIDCSVSPSGVPLGQALFFVFMGSNLRSRVVVFEAGYFLRFPFFLFFKPALTPFSVGFLKSGGWCLASFVEYG